MKKIGMIVISVTVLAIVGSAFAFNAKKGANFCVSTDGDNICDAILSDKKIVIGTANIKYYSGWDGDKANCIGRPYCTTILRLTDN